MLRRFRRLLSSRRLAKHDGNGGCYTAKYCSPIRYIDIDVPFTGRDRCASRRDLQFLVDCKTCKMRKSLTYTDILQQQRFKLGTKTMFNAIAVAIILL